MAYWTQINSWLSYKYVGRTVPAFKRNEETLKVRMSAQMKSE
jgi:HAUS augmin-like complex subunit 1